MTDHDEDADIARMIAVRHNRQQLGYEARRDRPPHRHALSPEPHQPRHTVKALTTTYLREEAEILERLLTHAHAYLDAHTVTMSVTRIDRWLATHPPRQNRAA